MSSTEDSILVDDISNGDYTATAADDPNILCESVCPSSWRAGGRFMFSNGINDDSMDENNLETDSTNVEQLKLVEDSKVKLEENPDFVIQWESSVGVESNEIDEANGNLVAVDDGSADENLYQGYDIIERLENLIPTKSLYQNPPDVIFIFLYNMSSSVSILKFKYETEDQKLFMFVLKHLSETSVVLSNERNDLVVSNSLRLIRHKSIEGDIENDFCGVNFFFNHTLDMLTSFDLTSIIKSNIFNDTVPVQMIDTMIILLYECGKHFKNMRQINRTAQFMPIGLQETWFHKLWPNIRTVGDFENMFLVNNNDVALKSGKYNDIHIKFK